MAESGLTTYVQGGCEVQRVCDGGVVSLTTYVEGGCVVQQGEYDRGGIECVMGEGLV